MTQLGLFSREGAEPDFTRAAALARRLPPHVRLGTSSWTFPGWAGLVYPRDVTEAELGRRGLELYCRHPLLSTVGIDRSYYAPLTTEEHARYARQLPPGFRAVSKIWSGVSSARHPRTREPNPAFLDPEVCRREVLAPLQAAFAEHQGPLVIELAPLQRRELPSTVEFTERLGRFLAALPRELPFAVELRNRELFTPAYLDVLREHGAAHVFNLWERMPALGQQLAVPGSLTAGFAVARLLIPPGERYAEQKERFAPFDRLQAPQPAMRDDVVTLSRAAQARKAVLFVIVNNKAEGSSPLTVEALAERLAAP